MDLVEDEGLLLAVLNSCPVVDGIRSDALEGASSNLVLASYGGTGSDAECRRLRAVRDALQELIRGEAVGADHLDALIRDVRLAPRVDPDHIGWDLEVASDERLAVRTALAWSRVQQELPGRLRPCANSECNLFLIDHSRPGTARWCSMSTCGNRMKARTHASRKRGSRSR